MEVPGAARSDALRALVNTAIVVLAIAVIRLQLEPLLGDRATFLIYTVPVTYAALRGGTRVGIAALLLGALATLVFAPGGVSSRINEAGDAVVLAIYFLGGGGAIALAQTVRAEHRRRLESERALETLNAELESRVSERTAQLQAATDELEGFCYSVAHDMRTPARAISGNARILIEDYGDQLNPRLLEHLGRINRASIKQGMLIDALLAYARLAKQPVEPESIDVASVAEPLLTELLRQEGGDASLSVQPGLRVVADSRMFRTALRAVLENSVRYRTSGHPAKIEITSDDQGRLVVRDDGIGFDMAYVAKVRLPFERLHRDEAYPGVGMGLALVDRIAHRHGGSLTVQSAPGLGTTVTLNLGGGVPVGEAQPVAVPSVAAPAI